MMLVIPDVLAAQDLADICSQITQASWHDGRETAGYAAMRQKNNLQLRSDDPVALAAGQTILRALSGNARFISFALPLKILPPMFNRYQGGGEYGLHIDNAIRVDPASGQRIRTDVSTTLFLNDPDDYDGGELIIHDTYGVERVKLPAGHAVVYPGTSLHRVSPVTRGHRLAAFFWTQSMVQDDTQRGLLFDLDNTIQGLAARADVADSHAETHADSIARLTGTYHNLIRMWAQT